MALSRFDTEQMPSVAAADRSNYQCNSRLHSTRSQQTERQELPKMPTWPNRCGTPASQEPQVRIHHTHDPISVNITHSCNTSHTPESIYTPEASGSLVGPSAVLSQHWPGTPQSVRLTPIVLPTGLPHWRAYMHLSAPTASSSLVGRSAVPCGHKRINQ